MSREFKFRVWNTVLKKYVCPNIVEQKYGLWLALGNEDNLYEFEQYTGLKDKNGFEIYEGDIVKCYSTADEPCLAVVRYGRMPDICGHEYCPCRIGFYLDDKVYFDEDFGEDDDYGDLEVIGNIHENPELLGGEE